MLERSLLNQHGDDREVSDEVLQFCYLIASSLSIFGSLIIIYTFGAVKELRRFPYSLVFCLSVCDFFFSLKYFIASFWLSQMNEDNSYLCASQAAWAQFWGLGSISWNGIISINIIFLLRNPFMNPTAHITVYQIYVWGLSLISAIFIVSSGFWANDPAYGVSGDGTCWITYDNPTWQLVFVLPLIFYFLVSFTCFGVALARSRTFEGYKNGRRRRILRMLFFSVVFIGVWTIPLIHHLLLLFSSEPSSYTVMEYAEAVCVSIQGFANAFVWLSNPYFRALVKRTPLILRITHCFISRKMSKEIKRTESSSLLPNSEDFGGILRFRQRVIESVIIGVTKAITLSSDQTPRRASIKILTTEDYDEQLIIQDFSRNEEPGENVNDSIRNTNQKLIAYAPQVYLNLLHLASIGSEDFRASFNLEEMLEVSNQQFSEGRSGSFFIFSSDHKYLLKTIPVNEAMLFNSILVKYRQHMVQNPESLIVKVFGVFAYETSYAPTVYLMIMENIFATKKTIHQRYDIKGSWVRRNVGEAHIRDPSILGMDEDFRRLQKKLKLGPKQRKLFLSRMAKDVLFFEKLGIIDYSLLVGIHEINDKEKESPESLEIQSGSFREVLSIDGAVIYYLGIIDMLQLYDCNKQSERWAKILCKCKDSKGLSVQNPKVYSTRLIKFCSKYSS